MSTKKILVVFGATGNQGGSVIKAILNDPATAETFHIRAITRDPSKPAATALAEKGVTVLKADLDDKDSLRAVMKDAYAVFAVTNFHERMNAEYEMQQGINIADVAKETNIQHLIWSTLPYAAKISNNKYTKVLHFDGKARVDEHIRKIGVPATFLLLGVFMNYILFYLAPDGSTNSKSKEYKITFPIASTVKWPLLSVNEDTGKYVKAILLNRERLLGKQICAGEKNYSIDETIRVMNEKGGIKVTLEQCSEDEYKKALEEKGLPDFFRDDMSENMQFVAEFGFFSDSELDTGHEILTEPLETFAEWLVRSPEVAALK